MNNSLVATIASGFEKWEGNFLAGPLDAVNQRAGAGTKKEPDMAKPDKAGRENAAEKSGGKSEGGGRANAPGQNKPRIFVHKDTGEQIGGTMNQFHDTLKDQGYRPIDEVEESDEPTAPQT